MGQLQSREIMRAFRDALGRFTTGVAVITSAPRGFDSLGITINSFSSVSLDPPLVLWCLDRGSDTLSAFEAATHFAVNVLQTHHESLSVRLSQPGRHGLDDLALRAGQSGSPILEDAFAYFDCEIHTRYEAGDHIIIIGRVLDFGISEGGCPLVYHAGAYQVLAP